MNRILLILLLILGWNAGAEAQGPSATARLSEGIVKLGARVTLLIEVEGAERAEVGALPTLDGLRLSRPGPPGEQTFMSITQGRRITRRVLTFAVPVQPERKGEYKLPAIEVLADGRTLKTGEQWLRVVEDLEGEQLGLFEIRAPSTVIEGQPFTVELRFGWETRQQGINYANLSLPWYPGLGGLLELDAPLPEPGLGTLDGIGINGQGSYRAEQLPAERKDGGEFSVLRIRRRFLATRSGAIEFPISHLEFGRVSQDFLLQREKRSFYKRVPAFQLSVLALPEEGRPLDFSGAVGALKASASADRRDVDVGDSIKLSVEWRGEGNLEFFDVPELDRMEAFRSFRFFGRSSERKTSERRSVVFDLAPLSDKVVEIPPVPLTVFHPATGRYETVQSQPIPIRVRARANATGLTEVSPTRGPAFDVRDIQTEGLPASESRGPQLSWIATALALIVLVWLWGRAQVRRLGDPASPRVRARRRALRQLLGELARAGDAREQAQAWHRFLGDRRGQSRAALEGCDPHALGAQWGLSPQLVRQWSALESELGMRIYGGGGGALDRARIEALARQLIGGGL
jgi:hypothetical protein